MPYNKVERGMKMRAYVNKAGVKGFKPSIKALEKVVSSDNSRGFCLGCGSSAGGVEPDARKYKCEGCGASRVYGAEELLLMGLYHA